MTEDLFEYIIDVDKEIERYEKELEKIERYLSILKEYKAQGKKTFFVDEHPKYK